MPRTPIPARTIAGSALLLCALSACVLNPQPLPPGTADSAAPADTATNPKLDAGEVDVALNRGDLEGGAGETGDGTDDGGIDGTLPEEAGADVAIPPPPGEAGSDAPAEAPPGEASTEAGLDADLSEGGAE
jgi:hypothetical protein